jgi:AraC-like DNA-binding protein
MNVYRKVIDSDQKNWPSWFIRAVDYIKANYHKRLTLHEISHYAGMSKYHFCRTFKTLTAHTVINYINSLRIKKAKEFLEESVLSITEISLQVGFNTISHFNTVFKRMVGITPSTYRKKYLE